MNVIGCHRMSSDSVWCEGGAITAQVTNELRSMAPKLQLLFRDYALYIRYGPTGLATNYNLTDLNKRPPHSAPASSALAGDIQGFSTSPSP
jgi:hypothetical protein